MAHFLVCVFPLFADIQSHAHHALRKMGVTSIRQETGRNGGHYVITGIKQKVYIGITFALKNQGYLDPGDSEPNRWFGGLVVWWRGFPFTSQQDPGVQIQIQITNSNPPNTGKLCIPELRQTIGELLF